jgi:hypothetical protein
MLASSDNNCNSADYQVHIARPLHNRCTGAFASVSGAYARLVLPGSGHELAMCKLGKQNTSQGVTFAM